MAVNIHIHAHQNDEDFEVAIAKQMFRLERDGQIVLTMRSKITAGEIIEDKVFENINDAEILVLLVSTAFLNEDIYFNANYLAYYEMFKKNKALLPVYCIACNWEYVPLLSDLKCIPGSGKPISRPLDNKEEQFKTVSKDIYAVACKIKQENQDKENEAREMQQKNIEFRECIDSAFREKNIAALISISRKLPKGNDEILHEIIDYIEILNAQSENL